VHRDADGPSAPPAGPPVELPGRPTAWPAPRPTPARPARDRRKPALLAAAVALLALLGVLLATQLGDDGRGAGTAAPPSTSASAAAASTTTELPVPPAGTGAAPAPAPSTTAAAQTSPAVQPTSAPASRQPPPQNASRTPQQTIVDYYAMMPGNLQEGWTWLTARYQQTTAGGFSGYQNWWSKISSVRTSGVVATGPNTVEATVEYTFKDGRVVRERHSYTMVLQDGRWLIDAHRVLSSVTL